LLKERKKESYREPSKDDSQDHLSNKDRRDMFTRQQFNYLIRNSRPWVKFSDYEALKDFLDEGEVAWAFLALKGVEGAVNVAKSSDPYLLVTNEGLKIYSRKAKGKRWDRLKTIPLEYITSWEVEPRPGLSHKSKNLKIIIAKSKTVILKGIPEELGVKFGKELTNQQTSKRKRLFEEEKEDLQAKVNSDKLPEELRDKLANIGDQDREEIKQTKKALTDYVKGEYVENFVTKYGSGTEGQLKKLQKLIAKRSGYEIEEADLHDLVNKIWRGKAREALKSLLRRYQPNSIEDWVEAFVLEFGRGNDEEVDLFAGIVETDQSKLEILIEDKLSSLREESELERLESELGLDREEAGGSEEKNRRDELSKEDRNIIKLLDSGKVSFEKRLEDLGGLEFESLVADLFEKMGYESKVTSGSGDQGADVIASNSFEKLAIQTKHYQGKVSNSAVQEAAAAVSYYDADRAVVITTSSFTRSAEELASSNNVELHGKKWLKSKVKKHLGLGSF